MSLTLIDLIEMQQDVVYVPLRQHNMDFSCTEYLLKVIDENVPLR